MTQYMGTMTSPKWILWFLTLLLSLKLFLFLGMPLPVEILSFNASPQGHLLKKSFLLFHQDIFYPCFKTLVHLYSSSGTSFILISISGHCLELSLHWEGALWLFTKLNPHSAQMLYDFIEFLVRTPSTWATTQLISDARFSANNLNSILKTHDQELNHE